MSYVCSDHVKDDITSNDDIEMTTSRTKEVWMK